MTDIKLDGPGPFFLPMTQKASASAAGEAVGIVLQVLLEDGSFVEVRTTLVAARALELAKGLDAAAAAAITAKLGRKPTN